MTDQDTQTPPGEYSKKHADKTLIYHVVLKAHGSSIRTLRAHPIPSDVTLCVWTEGMPQ